MHACVHWYVQKNQNLLLTLVSCCHLKMGLWQHWCCGSDGVIRFSIGHDSCGEKAKNPLFPLLAQMQKFCARIEC